MPLQKNNINNGIFCSYIKASIFNKYKILYGSNEYKKSLR